MKEGGIYLIWFVVLNSRHLEDLLSSTCLQAICIWSRVFNMFISSLVTFHLSQQTQTLIMWAAAAIIMIDTALAIVNSGLAS